MTQPPGGPQWDPKSKRWLLPGDQAAATRRTRATPERPTRGRDADRARATAEPPSRRTPDRARATAGGGSRRRPGPPPNRRPAPRRRWPWLVGGLAALLVASAAVAAVLTGVLPGVLTGGSGATETEASAPAPPPTAAAFPEAADAAAAARALGRASPPPAGAEPGVVFEVTGPGRASSITYSTPTAGPVRSGNDPLPWRKTLPAAGGELDTYLLTVQGGNDPGTISCRIILNGREIASRSSSGQFSVASCNGTSSPYG